MVDVGGAAVLMAESAGRRIVGLTGPEPAIGLALFDLRTCLGDAFPADLTQDVPESHAAAAGAAQAGGEVAGSAPSAADESGSEEST